MFCLHAETATSSDTDKVVVHSLVAHNYCQLQCGLEPFFSFFFLFRANNIIAFFAGFLFFLSFFFSFFFKYHVVLLQVIAFCAAVLSFFLLCFGFAIFGWF